MTSSKKVVDTVQTIMTISLACILRKLLEHIISSHINRFLLMNDALADEQHGFRSGRSCETQLIYTFDDLAHNREKGHITHIIVSDFSKAFDSVRHRKLFFKLQNYGINSRIMSWIECFLKGRSQIVHLDGGFSGRCDVLSGVPQGSMLGPRLFFVLH